MMNQMYAQKMRAIIESNLMVSIILVYFTGRVEGGLPKDCLFYRGKCVDHCPPDMYPYHTRCDVDTLSQRTCFFPETYILGFTCGWSRCDCLGETVLSDLENENCVDVTECDKDRARPRSARKRRRRKGKSYARLRDTDDFDEMHRGLEPIHTINEEEMNADKLYAPAPGPQPTAPPNFER